MKDDAITRLKIFSSAALLILTISGLALYLGLSDKSLLLSGLFDLLLLALIFALMAANFVYFRKKTADLYPRISRMLPLGSALAILLFFILEKPLLHSSMSAGGVVILYASLLATWTILNIVVSLTVGRRV